MARERVAATACAAAAAVVVALTLVPYVLGAPETVAVYYAAAPVGPLFVSLFAVVAVIVAAAGATGRTDPATAAGAAVVLGLFVAGAAWWWATSVSLPTAGAVSPLESFRYHRWAVAIAATAVALFAAWFAGESVGPA